MTKSLGQAYSIQTFDQYAIAKQVEQFEIISKALGKRFGISRTFGFENGICLCIDIYIVSTLLYETSTLTDRNNAI
jgi:hypothetical protein